ncbi:MAG: HEAT repeat domain-containing protein [Anaerolineaceae bacterium]|jgi:HEAT repeat protein|nr:HEAT repeat domain-containing protein [Anaerolineaceae bacterium]
MTETERISIQKFIETLLDDDTPEGDIILNRFSDLAENDLAALNENWPQINPVRRRYILQNLKWIADEDLLVCFDGIALMALDDPDAEVRANAIALLWEFENKKLIPTLIQLMQQDPSKDVRAAAATGLGKYVYLGEVEEISTEAYAQTENALLDTIRGEDDKLVRQHALEAISFSCHKAAQDEIRKASASRDPAWVASAMFAMGRSADKRWADMVLENLDHPESDVQLAAIIAAGELELDEARDPLLLLLEKSTQLDEVLQRTIVWSLSQIGGENVRAALEYLLEVAEQEEEFADMVEFLEAAIENLEFNEGLLFPDLFDIEMTDDDLYDPYETDGNLTENKEE